MHAFFANLAGGVCAHRGARSLAPENTLLAAALAHDLGADLWETDVRLAADGRPVLLHDATLGRTTDVAARPGFAGRAPWPAASFTADELASLDAGSWFIREDPYGTVTAGALPADVRARIPSEGVPTLADALALCRARRFPVNIELKDEAEGPDRAGLVAAVVAQVAAAGLGDLVLLSSFNHERLREVRRLDPALATAALVSAAHPADLVAYLQDLDVDAYHPHVSLVDGALIATLRAAGLHVNPWTVNDEGRARRLLAAGAAFVCTDWPQRLLR